MVVLDFLLSLYFRYPWADGEVILASGDVIVDFDVAGQLLRENFRRGSICGFGKIASLEQGSRHGVFAFGNDRDQGPTYPVQDFYQKSPVEKLRNECLVPGMLDESCALDTGIFAMSPEWCLAFFKLGAAQCDGKTLIKAVQASDIYFDFYVEVVMASLPGQTREQFANRVSGMSKLPVAILDLMHDYLGSLELRGALMQDCAFLHFGTLKEFPAASLQICELGLQPFYAHLAEGRRGDWNPVPPAKRGDPMIVNSQAHTVRLRKEASDSTEMVWVEMCADVQIRLSPSGFHLLVGLQDVKMERQLPEGFCLDGRFIQKEAAGSTPSERSYIVAVYAAADTFKKVKQLEDVLFCGIPFHSWLQQRRLRVEHVWSNAHEAASCTELWTAKLFPATTSADSLAELLPGYWDASCFRSADFIAQVRFSLEDLNRLDSALDRDVRRCRLI